MPIRQIDRMRWDDRRCLLTRTDLQAVPEGTTSIQLLSWAGTATGLVNTFLRALTAS